MKIYPGIDDRLRNFIQSQQMFFVATAPSGPGGHVNLSPKGLDSLRVLGPLEVAYTDYTGSGAETIAHLRENGRMVVMFCAFQGPPKIVRLYGSGSSVLPSDAGFPELLDRMHAAGETPVPTYAGLRSIIRVEVERVSDSCGYSVPLYRYEAQRTQLTAWAEKKTEAELEQYRKEHNEFSIDELPALSKG